MLLEIADYLPLILLAPFLALELAGRARRYAVQPRWRLGAMLAFRKVA